MSGPLVYVDTAQVREGALAELKGAIRELVEFVEANEPQLIAYGTPSEKAMRLLSEKASLLGTGNVVVQPLEAGFTRLGAE